MADTVVVPQEESQSLWSAVKESIRGSHRGTGDEVVVDPSMARTEVALRCIESGGDRRIDRRDQADPGLGRRGGRVEDERK